MVKQSDAEPKAGAVPKEWPGAFGVYKYSKAAVMLNLQPLLLVIIISIVLSAITSGYRDNSLVGLLAWIVTFILSIAETIIFIKGVRGEKISFNDSLNESLPRIIPFFLLTILGGLAVVVSILLLVVPFFFVLPRVIMSFYYLIDKQQAPVEAFKSGWNNAREHGAKVWGIIGVNLLMALLMVTIIGIPVALYLLFMYSAAMAVAYRYIDRHS